MLGELLEFSAAANPLGSTVELFRTLGFREAPVGNIVDDAYVPMSLAAVTVGLRPEGPLDPVPTFVRPDLKQHLRGFKHLEIPLEFSHVADDQFHRAGFRDPNGLLVVLLEARTSSPLPLDASIVSPLGEFLEYSTPTHSLEDSGRFWDTLGVHEVAAGDSPQPWRRVQGHGLTLGLYAGRRFRPGLCFVCDNAAARIAYLEAKGCHLQRPGPFGLPDHDVVVLDTPAQPIYLAGRP